MVTLPLIDKALPSQRRYADVLPISNLGVPELYSKIYPVPLPYEVLPDIICPAVFIVTPAISELIFVVIVAACI